VGKLMERRGRDHDGHRTRGTEQLQTQLGFPNPAQDPWDEANARKSSLVRSQGDLVVSPAGEEIVRCLVELLPRLGLHLAQG
jgi:hypothetical protein